ncbi:MAG: Histidine Kinase [Gemmatimonadetes bacterium]|nr:Histidine Kinase [Gemmatimonadota bacterium]
MRLADFILSNVEPILVEWEAFARGIAPGAKMNGLALRDHAADILLATARDMRSAQTATERTAKSKGRRDIGGEDGALDGASESHAMGRLGGGFDLLQMVSEYRAMRASVLRLWGESGPAPHECDVDDLTRFNESVDQSVTKAVASYTRRVDQSRDLFLAILSHDLRNPLNSITMSAALLPQLGRDDPEAIRYAAQIGTSAQVMARMISDLLDYTRTRLGAGMPVSPARMDLGLLCRAIFDEFRSAHPNRVMSIGAAGDLSGDWDADRLRQAVSNLMGNAVQHGSAAAPIVLTLDGRDHGVVFVEVHNGGPPIPPGELIRIFDPLVRGSSAQHPKTNRPGSIGLGLYIAREIARSHGGRIDVTSAAAAGTSFTIHLPRHGTAASAPPILDARHLRTL